MSLILSLLLLMSPTFNLRIIHVGGLFAVSDIEAREIYNETAYYFQEVGLTPRVKWFDVDYNPCIYKHHILFPLEEIQCFAPFASERKKVITFVMTPPFITLNRETFKRTTQIAGAALRCKNLSIGNAESNSIVDEVVGDSRIPHSATILAHEVFHNMCATHQEPAPNLMHPSANDFTTSYKGKLPVLRVTKRQVKRWYVKRRKI